MGEKTNISWTDHTFNPWIGCTKVSDGCKFCYAERDNRFFKWNPNGWGPQAARRRTSEANWQKPLEWNKAAERDGVRRKVFCASLADICDDHPSILPRWRYDLAWLSQQCTYLDMLFLTKRPENFMPMYSQYFPDGLPDNIWLGVTAENQEMADKRISILQEIPARIRFLSCEPLLEGIQFRDLDNIDWVIGGGESGAYARPMHSAWARSLRDQCQAADIAFFFKQWGEWVPDPWTNETLMVKIGRKAAGDLLDGEVYHEFPDYGRPK